MLERYYVRPRTVDRIRALWLGPAIDRYVGWLAERQAAKDTVAQSVQTLVQFNDFVCAQGVTTWEELPAHVEPFMVQWIQKHGGWCRTLKERTIIRGRGRIPVEQLLRLLVPGFVGTVRPPLVRPFQTSAPDFFNYLREERGLRPGTLHGYEHHLRAFEGYLQRVNAGPLSAMTPALLTPFLTDSAQRLGPGSVKLRSGTLRVFLHYLHRQGIIPTDLSQAVPCGRHYRQATLPRAITWEQVQRALESVDRRAPVGKRDYAILLLLATYGLRAREVVALRLEDLDWPHAQLRVSARKGGHSTIYPLAEAVAEAIIDYLRHGRPPVMDRHLFFTTRAPYRPMPHELVSRRAWVALQAAGIDVRRAGSHTFRYACVQHLVEADVPFKVIGDYVGHRTPASTQRYGKIALHQLRPLVLGEAEEAL